MGVRVLPDMGVPVHMAAAERLLWSPTARHVDLDGAGAAHLRRTIEPVTAAVCCLGFDLRASAPPIKPERREVELRVNAPADGSSPAADVRMNAILYWFELHLGGAAVLSSAPRAALPEGATHMQLGQGLQFLPAAQSIPSHSAAGSDATVRLVASHNRHSLSFDLLAGGPAKAEAAPAVSDLAAEPSVPTEPGSSAAAAAAAAAAMVAAAAAPQPAESRRGLVLAWPLQQAHDGHLNRTYAAALRKALLRMQGRAALVLSVGCGIGLQPIVAAQARPEARTRSLSLTVTPTPNPNPAPKSTPNPSLSLPLPLTLTRRGPRCATTSSRARSRPTYLPWRSARRTTTG